ncbi:MAG: hypothetical protein GEU83_11635 [Pseudonocardiaceae bacterium]|nr:hypothetical protein [Pseudonocardiaceae bacterium]
MATRPFPRCSSANRRWSTRVSARYWRRCALSGRTGGGRHRPARTRRLPPHARGGPRDHRRRHRRIRQTHRRPPADARRPRRFNLGGPVNRAARRLWGAPVVVSTSLAANTAYLVDFAGSTELHMRQDATVDWSENLYDPDALGAGVGASDWARNLIRWRAEMRAGFVVKRAAGVVKIDLTQPV